MTTSGDWLRAIRARLFEWSGRNRRARARLDGSRAAVLNFHRVLPPERARALSVEPGMWLAPDAFRMVLETLVRHFRVLPLHEVATSIAERRPLPERACAISFDDGWRDNYDHALPELSRFGLPATIFVVSERVGTSGAFWPDEVCRCLASRAPEAARELALRLGAPPDRPDAEGVLAAWKGLSEREREGPLALLREAHAGDEPGERELATWAELEAMREAGLDVESHGATHALLAGLPPDALARELAGSLNTLERRGFARHRLFAYPSGQHSPELERAVAEAGYRAGFALDEALASLDSSPTAIPRLGVHQGIAASPAHLLAKIPGHRSGATAGN